VRRYDSAVSCLIVSIKNLSNTAECNHLFVLCLLLELNRELNSSFRTGKAYKQACRMPKWQDEAAARKQPGEYEKWFGCTLEKTTEDLFISRDCIYHISGGRQEGKPVSFPARWANKSYHWEESDTCCGCVSQHTLTLTKISLIIANKDTREHLRHSRACCDVERGPNIWERALIKLNAE